MNRLDLRSNTGVRLAIISIISLLLMIPAGMISGLIIERETRRNEAVGEISQKWGQAQTLTGPILTIPVRITVPPKNEKELPTVTIHYAHFLPDELDVEGTVEPEVRYRGIYEAVLYTSNLKMRGSFPVPHPEQFNVKPEDILWGEAFLSLGIADMKGIRKMISIALGDRELSGSPGFPAGSVLCSGMSFKAPVDPQKGPQAFSVNVLLNGSQALELVPLGKETRVAVNSRWRNPSFTGDILPETRVVQDDSFSAQWKTFYFNRSYPQQWLDAQICAKNLEDSSFGVKFLMPVDQYQKVLRTSKYALMFICLTFLAFVMIELFTRRLLHPVQYLLIGFAMVLFYSLLLSLTEHLGFAVSYLAASLGMIALIAGYTRAVMGNLQAGIIAAIVGTLYGFLYFILQLQDYALLLGSLGLFAVLGSVMYLTRNIDWFTVKKTEDRGR
ncbi:MAG: cell envelope integrity protein CreD [Thermodesulfobacteriota bacterium]